MKSIYHSLYRAVLLFALLIPMAAMAATRHISIPTFQINPGTVADVPITLDNATGLAGLRMQVNFNPEVLSLEAVNTGTLGASFEMIKGTGDGFVQLTFVRANALPSGSGRLATLKFRTNEGALPGQKSELAIADLALSDASGLIDMHQKDSVILTVGNVSVKTGPKGDNANLSGLTLSAASLSPAFGAAITNYTAAVGYAVSSIRITPTLADSTASIKVNGTTLASGVASPPIALAVGVNTITVLVKAQNGTATKTYRVAVTRAASANANLSGLALNTGSLSPVFAATTTNYTTTVGNAVGSIRVTPKIADNTASIKVNGTAQASGVASQPIALAVGSNTITVLVTAQNGTTTKSYRVIATRAASSNAKLSGLALSAGSLSPVFATTTMNYTMAVGNAVNSIRVTPKAVHKSSSIKVNGFRLASGATSMPIALSVGTNTISVLVTAQNGTTKKRYTITVTRAASSVAKLSGLAVNNGSLSPDFSPSTTNYTMAVGNSIDSIRITPKTANNSSSIKVNGSPLASGATSTPIPLAVGTNTITVLVTAQNGVAKKTYTLLITRAQSSNNRLAKVTASNVTLSPSFKSYHAKYQATVSETLTKVSFKTVAKSKVAKIKINGQKVRSGTESASYPLNVGKNTFTITVTAQDGSVRKYSIVITRPSGP